MVFLLFFASILFVYFVCSEAYRTYYRDRLVNPTAEATLIKHFWEKANRKCRDAEKPGKKDKKKQDEGQYNDQNEDQDNEQIEDQDNDQNDGQYHERYAGYQDYEDS